MHKRTRLLVTMEISRRFADDGHPYEIVVSLPGNRDTFIRTFRSERTPLNESNFAGLLEWIEVTVGNLILLSDGVQEPLPGV